MSAPRVYDLFMFRDELDMLEVRLREFEATDTVHVLCESGTDHRGHPKPLWYAENRERFAPWSERIVHITANGLPLAGPPCPTCGRGAPWITEHAQRDAGWAAVEEQVRDQDTVLVGDIDEFPNDRALEGVFPVATLSMRLLMYAADWQVPQEHLCGVVASGRYMRGKLPSAVRDGRYGYYAIQSAGLHITWVGGIPGQRAKLEATCHTEMRADEIERIRSGLCYETGVHHAGDLQLLPVDVTPEWPKQIYERKVPSTWFRPRT